MKTLYFDCGMGAAGDMLTAALLELLPNPDEFVNKLNSLGIPGILYSNEKSVKCGITGTHMSVTINGAEEQFHDHHYDHDHEHHHEHEHHHDHDHEHHEHHHSGMHDIEHIVEALNVSAKVKNDILAVYGLIAEAESHAHGVPVSEIHFHEVGSMDAIADVAAVCLLIDEISPEKIVCSPIHVGSGHVHCAHGILPVPAPATAYILQNIPTYGGGIKGELCTPTGAALLKYFVSEFGNMPVMKTKAIGYGMGKKDFSSANCVRAMLGDGEDKTDFVVELACNVDDMTAEEIGFAIETLFEGGALEAFAIPTVMKKSRPGTLIQVLCREDDKDNILKLIFKHTSTIGIRENISHRYVLDRSIDDVATEFGNVRCKISSGYDVVRKKYEYEDIAQIAKKENLSIREVRAKLQGDE